MPVPRILSCLAFIAACIPAQSFAELRSEYWNAMSGYAAHLQKAIAEKKPRRAWPGDPTQDFYRRFSRLTKERAGTRDEVDALFWLYEHGAFAELERGLRVQVARAKLTGMARLFDRLLDVAGDAPRLVKLIRDDTPGGEEGRALLEKAVARSRNPEVRAWALHRLADRDWSGGFVDDIARNLRARAAMRRLVREFPSSEAARRAGPLNFALEHLVVGGKPPALDAKDSEGRPVSLAAERGKVVVIVFWGFW